MAHFHVWIAYDAEPWKESEHPRGKGGRFGSGGGGIKASSAAWTGRPEGGPSPGKVGRVTRAVKSFSKEDYETIKKHLPGAQKSLGQKLASVAKALPSLLKAHLKEEKEKAIHAAGALGALARGKKPTPEQFKGLRQFGLSLMLSTASMLTHGDPTGAVGHVAMVLGQELVDHAIMEHTAKFGAGVARFAYHAVTGGGDQELGDADVKLLQDFAQTLARVVAEHKIPEARLAELFGQHEG